MTEWTWMADTLRLMTLDELRDSGVTVYQAPKLPKRSKVVNLTNGIVVDFSVEGELPDAGCYGKYEDIMALAGRFGIELVEENRVLVPARSEISEAAEVEA